MHPEPKTNPIASIERWTDLVFPQSTNQQKNVQLGAITEEMSEFFASIRELDSLQLAQLLNGYSHEFYSLKPLKDIDQNTNRLDNLDAIADVIFTLVVYSRMMGYDLQGALAEVVTSNFSKFEDGKPVYNEHGKLAKGKHYQPPKLEAYLHG